MKRIRQDRLFFIAAAFLTLYAVSLTLSPAARERSWEADFRWSHWSGLLVWALASLIVFRHARRFIPESDPYLLPLTFLLAGWGILSIWRLDSGFGIRQSAWLAIGALVFTAILRLPKAIPFLRNYKYLWLTGGLLLTATTLIFGTNPVGSGPRLWLGCCGLYLQPSEPLKLLLVVYLAAYFADRSRIHLGVLPLILPTAILSSLALIILVVQRDLGTATIFIFLYSTLLYLSFRRRRVLVISLATLLLAGAVGYYFVDIIQLRVDAWLNPWADPSGMGYQIIQSLLAIANGEIVGRGPGLGNPSLVPVAISDFIFSAIAEEFGLAGTFALFILIGVLVSRGVRIALRAPDNFKRLLAGGLTAYLGGQSLLIIGGNLRLLPITGVTLPLVSYGGSSLVTSLIAVALLMAIDNHPDSEPAPITDPGPYYHFSAFIGIGLMAAALVNGWWTVVRGPDLLTRSDNPRRSISDRFVPRGKLLDRSNNPINITEGVPGSLTRTYLAPDLAPLVGYTHPVYGQAGIEASLDDYLRGVRGNPASMIWWNFLLYGQPPNGLDVRLSLNLPLQDRADRLLGNHPGAIVLINAQTGEILAIASHPTFDPNRLDQDGQQLAQDPRSPLLNRATLGSYPAGTALAPYLLAAVPGRNISLDTPGDQSVVIDGARLDCARPPEFPTVLTNLVASGCPGAQNLLGTQIPTEELIKLFDSLGFYTTPLLRIQVSEASEPPASDSQVNLALGQSLRISPLQLALAAAAISNHGIRPAPRLAIAVNTPQQGWVVLPALETPVQALPAGSADLTAQALAASGVPFWHSVGQGLRGDSLVTWYQSGTPPDWQGTPLAVVVVLEENNPSLAMHIGQLLLNAAIVP